MWYGLKASSVCARTRSGQPHGLTKKIKEIMYVIDYNPLSLSYYIFFSMVIASPPLHYFYFMLQFTGFLGNEQNTQ